MKKSSTLAKTGAQQMGISNNPITGGLADIPEHKQKPMMESYAKFYGVEGDAKVNKLSYNKLYQASREQGKGNNVDVPQTMKNDPAYKQAAKKFFQNEVSDTASAYNLNTGKFFDGGAQGKLNPGNTIGDKFQGV
jgi:hypothetical protein